MPCSGIRLFYQLLKLFGRRARVNALSRYLDALLNIWGLASGIKGSSRIQEHDVTPGSRPAVEDLSHDRRVLLGVPALDI